MSAIAMILKSLTMNFQLLREWEAIPDNPVWLTFHEGGITEIKSFVKSISCDGIITDSSVGIDKFKDNLYYANSQGVFFVYPPYSASKSYVSVKTTKFLETINGAFSFGQIDGRVVTATPIVISCGKIPNEFQNMFTVINIDSEIIGDFDNNNPLYVSENDLSLVQRVLQNYRKIQSDNRWLYYALAFWYPCLNRNNQLEVYKTLYKEVERIDKQVLIKLDETDLADCVEMLLDIYLKNNDCHIYFLPDISEEAINNIEDSIFVKDNFIYLKEQLFKKIMEPAFGNLPIDKVKKLLKDNEILIGKSGDYTVKMNVNINNSIVRYRMLKIDLTLMPNLELLLKNSGGY